MRRGACFVLACVCFGSIATVTFGVDLETYSKRMGDTDGLVVALVEWRTALEQATSDDVDARVLLDLLARFDRLWSSDNKFQRDVSKQLVERVKGIKPNTIADWQAALKAATGDAPSKVNTLLLLIQQDRIFEKSVLVERAERAFVARLKTLPPESVREWATTIADVTEPGTVAAVQLASDDSLFNDGAFQAGAFQTLLENARRKTTSSVPAPTAKPANDAVARLLAVRTWTDSTGRHSIEAAFVNLAAGRVTLKKKSGATVTLAVEKLSAADRDWLKKNGGAEPTPEQCREFLERHGGIWWIVKDMRRRGFPAGTAVAGVNEPFEAEAFSQAFGKPKNIVNLGKSGGPVSGISERWEYGRIAVSVDQCKVTCYYEFPEEYYEFPKDRSEESTASSSVAQGDPATATPANGPDRSPREPSAKSGTGGKNGFAALPEGWPKRSGDLSGRDEVRVKNPNDFQVRVGLRSAGKGKDFVVPAGGVQSVHVPNGKYDIYFQYSTDPTGLYQGDSFTLADNGVEIQIVKVVNGNYGIRKVK